ncbi:MAG TPA: serine acetyltransferase [Acidisarcina sp.]
MFENLKEDWRTYNGDISRRGLWCMVVYRYGNWRYTIKNSVIRKPFSLLYKILKVVSEVLTSIELPCEAPVGRRLIIEHASDVVVSGDAVLGDDVVLRNGVTIGLRNRGVRGSPKIGNRVDIGAGAKLLGPITIGDDVLIGANAVVLSNVPSGYMAVGNPARIRPR